MSFIRYKKFGKQEYAYEIISYWDTKLKRPRQKTKYLGVVIDKEKGVYKKKSKFTEKEKLILDFGDTYLIHQFLINTNLLPIIKDVFGKSSNFLETLICYRLCNVSAMKHLKIWYEGNIAKILIKNNDVSSQRISEFLKEIGDEKLEREFFKKYISKFVDCEEGIIIDTTALPNQIQLPFNQWGYNDGNIEKQIKFLFVVDKENSLPIYFRYLPGNIVDVSTLKITLEEVKKYGIKGSFLLLDAGFYSEDNIKEIYKEKIQFLTRLPSSKKLYKELIKKEAKGLESYKNAVRYGKRVLFIKERRVSLFGKQIYSYIVLDPERKGREMRKELLKVLEGSIEKEEEEIEYEIKKKGIMILIARYKIEKKEIVPLYYLRQKVEKLFNFSKEDLKMIPLRVHKEETLRGYLFLLFITLIVFVLLKQEIGKEYTVEEILMVMRNLKCKVYKDKDIIIQELTKQQKEILEKLKILVANFSGI